MNITGLAGFLNDGWNFFQTQADQYSTPKDFAKEIAMSRTTSVPSTIASASNLDKQQCWKTEINYDDFDWWYQKEFTLTKLDLNKILKFEGLATIAQVWLNGELLLESENMFHSHECDIEKQLIAGKNVLTICFRSMSKRINQKHPRPKWKTKLVSNQSLRWYRTTLLGKIPTWTPSISAVGPWRPISLVKKDHARNIQVSASVKNNIGQLKFSCLLTSNITLKQASLQIADKLYPIKIEVNGNNYSLTANIEIPEIKRWWPHTHGEPYLYEPILDLKFEDRSYQQPLQKVGFRNINLSNTVGTFDFKINKQHIFCRGACWTIDDIFSLNSTEQKLEKLLLLFKNAGGNMIRIGGTMVYEQTIFYQICDRLGIMVWQDFMFANMDYPFEETSFLSSVSIEAKQQISRLNKHACMTIFCGNSEIQQQVAMQGFDKSLYKIKFFEETLKEFCFELAENIPYISSSPSEGNLPFRTNQGVTHYYGVGAYLKPVKDVRSHNIKFTSECLGFSNIPSTHTRNLVLDGALPITHNPIWKERTPRDSGTGWDFEDVRDHYLKETFCLDPVKLRSFEPEKYIQLSEFISGYIMEQVFSEWRSSFSSCNGALIWFMKDFLPGAGWGIIDSQGIPKACYYFLKRSWKPQSIVLTDESLNGLYAHINNEYSEEFKGDILVKVINQNHDEINNTSKRVSVPPRSSLSIDIEELLGQFIDSTYSYRFGPKEILSISVELLDSSGQVIDQAFYFNQLEDAISPLDHSIKIKLEKNTDLLHTLTITTNQFLFNVNIECKNAIADDNFFHLFPNTEKKVQLQVFSNPEKHLKGFVNASNMKDSIRFKGR